MKLDKKLYPGRAYPVLMKLRYKTVTSGKPVTGAGITLKMSRTEILFTAEPSIELGTKVELSMEWPVLLDGRVALQLVMEAKITASEDQTLTADIQRYRFRTRGTGARLQEIAAGVVQWPVARASAPEQPVALRAHA